MSIFNISIQIIPCISHVHPFSDLPMLDLAILGFYFLLNSAQLRWPVASIQGWKPGIDGLPCRDWTPRGKFRGQHWVQLRVHPLPSRPWTQIFREKNRISATKRMQIYAGAGVRGISVCPTPLPSEPKGNLAMRDNASWAASSRPKKSRMTRWYLYRMPITSDLLLMTVGSCGPAVKNDQLLILQRSQLQPPWLSVCFSTACTRCADWNPIGRSG